MRFPLVLPSVAAFVGAAALTACGGTVQQEDGAGGNGDGGASIKSAATGRPSTQITAGCSVFGCCVAFWALPG